MTTKSTSFQENGPVKKSYESPRLVVYGDIREITKAAGSAGSEGDGGVHPNNKTS
jgi:hypothetical protein